MDCDFEYCIYNRDFKCTVDSIEINSMGMCDSCIIVSLDKNFLEKEKERQLNNIERRYSENKKDS